MRIKGAFSINKWMRLFLNSSFSKFLTDEKYLQLKFRVYMGHKLNLKCPCSFSEKLQWLKLYDRKEEYTKYVDKYLVREYIKEQLGEEYLIPLIGVWDEVDEIDFDSLPEQFVIKCNHNSGRGMCICKNKSELNLQLAKKKLKEGIAENYYLKGREWPYKNVKRKIVAEKFMCDHSQTDLVDYKFMCFNGEVKCCFVCTDRQTNLKITVVDSKWNVVPVRRYGLENSPDIKPPQNWELMLEFAAKLSAGIPFVRIDFYEINQKIYFGEITFFPASGFEKFEPYEWDNVLGDWLKLPQTEIC